MTEEGPAPDAEVAVPDEQQLERQHAQEGGAQAQANMQEPSEVEVKVKNITREALSLFERMLVQWAEWQQSTYVQGYPPNQQLVSGSLVLDVQQLCNDGLVAWRDSIAPVPGTARPQANRAATYEQTETIPMYDRGINELLAPPPVPGGGISMLPGGAEATRRRQMAEARLVLDECADVPSATPSRRKRLPASRCFNCGSYAHSIAQCTREHNSERIAAAKAERNAGNGGPVAALMRQRYFQADGGGKRGGKANPFEGIVPGEISAELAQAVGMHSQTAPPPWLGRMAVLGLPPRYTVDDAAADGSTKDIMTFIMGSDDEDDETAGVENEQASSDAGQEQQADGNGSEPADDPADADYVPIEVEQQSMLQVSVAEEPEQQHSQQHVACHTVPHPGQTLESPANGVTKAQAAPAAGGKHRRALVQFPGINGPLPEIANAEQWQVELEKASYVAGMLGLS